MELFIENVDLEIMIDEVMGTIQPLLENKNNQFKVERSDVLGTIQTDVSKLRQILLNLLSNAAKFTEKGTIHFKITHQTRRHEEWVIFCVADDGIGMTEAQQDKLFQPFTQADNSTTRRYGGTGLGLTITKQFTEMMDGMLQVNSEHGVGSTFTLYLPVETKGIPVSCPDKSKTLHKLETNLSQKIILIIDDNSQRLCLFKDELNKLGHRVAVVANGDEGLKLAYKIHPDIIVLNVQMSDMEGWRILATLKNDSFLVTIRVILMVMMEDNNQWYLMDATECLNKMAVRTQIAVFLEKYHIDNDPNDLIMVVEDDKVWGETLRYVLEEQSWRVFLAENGQIALEHLNEQQPKFILLDLNMPVMGGFEFLTHLKNNEKWCSIPVVVLTSKNLSVEEHVHLNRYVKTILQKETYTQDELPLHIHELIADVSV